MQMEGADVFMSTFSLLKRFDFFNTMSNWFIPFYPDHPALHQNDPGDREIQERLSNGLEKAFYICNSDKYSFALNFQAIPAQQRTMIVTHFEAELEQMKDMASEEELLDPTLISNAIVTQYIQDLYRFFKLFPFRHEFDDIFQWRFRIHNLSFYLDHFKNESFLEKIAAFLFDKEHWSDSINLYSYLNDLGQPKSERYQKIGYAYQQQENYTEAIRHYEKAELFDTDHLWILKKLSWCLIKNRDYEHAAIVIDQALKLQPNNLKLHSQAGQCQLNLKAYDQAMQHYSQVRYYSPGNLNALRPIAYCQFITGKLDQAIESYEEILETVTPPSPYDLINAGHVALCMGNREKAWTFYSLSLKQESFSKELFVSAFEEDIEHLTSNGINPDEIPLILDYLLIR